MDNYLCCKTKFWAFWDSILIITDNISAVSNVRLLQIHKCLCEMFGYYETRTLAGKTVIFVCDLLQLLPVKAPNVFSACIFIRGICLKMWEWNEVMRQRGNLLFIDALNAARTDELSDKDVEVFNSRKSDVKSVLTETLLIFDENSPKDCYDRSNLDSLWEVGIETYDIDKVPQRTPTILIENLHKKVKTVQKVWNTASIWRKMHE